MKKDMLTIAQVAKETGISPSILRVWELRYGWPKPMREANRYRRYSAEIVSALKEAAALIAAGRTIGDILRDQNLRIMESAQDRRHAAPPRPRYDFSVVPAPTTRQGQEIRDRLEQAIRHNDHQQIEWAKAQGLLLRPSERELAVTAVLRVPPSPPEPPADDDQDDDQG
jgi:DNA-binding transcriptional MerR regulator